MKKTFMLLLAAALAAGASAHAEAPLPGAYEAEAAGFGGPVKVTLTVEGDALKDAAVEGAQETPEIGGAALETLREQLLEAGSAEIDGVSGATVTSNGVRAAAETAFALARGETPAEAAEVELPEGVTLGENEYFGTDPNGANGTISVKVTVVDGAITAVKVLEQHETRGLGTTAMLKIIDEMVNTGSADVDSVAGATLSSGALKRAVNMALESAAK